jgi:hypothetical protein
MNEPLPPTYPTGPDPSVAAGARPKRSWWGRNWFWVVPVGCLLPILSCGGFFALIVTLVFGMLKSSQPYTDSLATLQSDQRVVVALGTPIEADFMVTGQININGPSGNADISYGVSGPLGSADVHVVANKSAGQWTFTEFVVDPDGGQRIDMLATP